MRLFRRQSIPRAAREGLIILSVACVVYFVLRSHYTSGGGDIVLDSQVQVGESLSQHPTLDQMDPPVAMQEKMIAIVVDSTCSISQKDADFHAELLDASRRNGITTVLLNAPRSRSNYRVEDLIDLSDFGFEMDPRQLGVFQTPTILLLEYGKIVGMWVGQLFELQRGAVLRRATGKGHTIAPIGQPNEGIGIENDSSLIEYLNGRSLVDVNGRNKEWPSSFGAINLPLDEIPVRARIDLDPDIPVVVDCSYLPDAMCGLAGIVLEDMGFIEVSALNRGGFFLACSASRYSPDSEDRTDCAECSSDNKIM